MIKGVRLKMRIIFKMNNDESVGLFNDLHFIAGAVAACLSYAVNKSLLWAIIHGVCSWFYLFYYIFSIKGFLINV